MRVLPRPLLSAAILLTWLALNDSLDPAHVLLGLLLALIVPLLIGRFLPLPGPVRRPFTMLRLLLRVLVDVVVANLEVARRVLGPESRIRSRFVWVPLDIRSPHGITALAAIVALTPGTLSVEFSADRRHLLVHGLHVENEAALIRDIKTRYERPLREIFP
jgi:multicomponent K+:H+ antiporter subunit E